MSKLGKFVTFAVIAGAAAVGVSYALQNRKESAESFGYAGDGCDDYVDESAEKEHTRSYTTLSSHTEEISNAAKETWTAAKNLASVTKDALVDGYKYVSDIATDPELKDKAEVFKSKAYYAAADALENAKDTVTAIKDKIPDVVNDVVSDAGTAIGNAINTSNAEIIRVTESINSNCEKMENDIKAGISVEEEE